MDNPRVIAGGYELLTPERKAEYFRRLTLEERHDVFEGHLEFVLALRPEIARRRHEAYPPGLVRVVRLP